MVTAYSELPVAKKPVGWHETLCVRHIHPLRLRPCCFMQIYLSDRPLSASELASATSLRYRLCLVQEKHSRSLVCFFLSMFERLGEAVVCFSSQHPWHPKVSREKVRVRTLYHSVWVQVAALAFLVVRLLLSGLTSLSTFPCDHFECINPCKSSRVISCF